MPRRQLDGYVGGSVALGVPKANGAPQLVSGSSASLSPGSGSWSYRLRALIPDAAQTTKDLGFFVDQPNGWAVLPLGTQINVYVKSFSVAVSIANGAPIGRWCLYSFVFDASTHTIYVYRDGTLIGQSAANAWSGSLPASGAFSLNRTSASTGGYVQDIALAIGTAWTAAQVAADAAGTATPPGITHRWPLDDGLGTSPRATVGTVPMTIAGGAAFSANSSCLLRNIARNNQPYSEDLTQTPTYGRSNLTPSAGITQSGIALNLLTTSVDVGAAVHSIITSSTLVPTFLNTGERIASIFAKAGSLSWLSFGGNGDVLTASGSAYFDLTNGLVGNVASGCTAGMIDYGSGLWRCWVKFTQQNAIGAAIAPASGDGGVSFQANAGTIYAGGLMNESCAPGQTTPSPYVATGAAPLSVWGSRETRQNYARWSENFAKSVWIPFAGNIFTENTADILAPNGTQTATKVEYDGSQGAGSIHTYQIIFPIGAASRVTYNNSVWLRTASGTRKMRLYINGATALASVPEFAVTTTWQRFSFSDLPAYTGFVPNQVQMRLQDGATENGTTPFYAWGAQFVQGSSMSDYIATTSSIANASGAPRQKVT